MWLGNLYPVIFCGWMSLFIVICDGQVNRAPEFLFDGDMARFSLGEGTPIGSSVYTLRASDPEGTKITYGIVSEYFSVNNETGEVTLIKGLDRETQDSIDVVIRATDVQLFGTKPNVVESDLVIQVLDINDNSPKFQGVPYSFAVDETTLLGTTVYDGIFVSDKDTGLNAEITLTCDVSRSPQACKHFQVTTRLDSSGQFQGIVTLKSTLDYEETAMYILTIKAEDSQNANKKTAFVNVVVEVRDSQDQLPQFESSPYFAAVAEGTSPNMSLMTINVQDGDKGNSRPLHIELIESMGYFRLGSMINDSRGLYTVTILTADTLLDYEDAAIVKSDGQYVFNIKATELEDGKHSQDFTTTSVTILITDVNDNPPVLSRAEINISIPEDIRSNFLLSDLNLIVDDIDSGENSQYQLALDSDDSSKEIFSLDSQTGEGRAPVNIRIVNNSAVDYENTEKRKFHFKVVAWDKLGRQSLTLVHVSVEDSNDNSPVFEHLQYNINASENSVPGTVLHTIAAKDEDSGINGLITYSLQGFGAEWFNLNALSGEISVADCGATTCLDYEKTKQYTLTYSARDGLGRAAATSIIVDVIDVNDNPPTFVQREIIRNIPAGVTNLSPPLMLKASDKDSALNGNNVVTYKIIKSDAPGDLFSMNAKTGEIQLQKQLQTSLATQTTQSYTIHVEAEDSGTPSLSEDAYIIVTITGTADGRFFFVHPLYNSSVLETAAEGTIVAEVTAIDAAATKDTVVTYRITNGSHDNLVIDSTTGVITVAPSTTLDLEISPKEYTITVQAVSSDSHLEQTATTLVYLKVEDVNNKSPNFERDFYTLHLGHGTTVGERLEQVTATDPDEDHLLQYSIMTPILVRDRSGVLLAPEATTNFNDAFQINSTSGEIFLNARVDHSAASVVYVTAKVVDMNANPRSGEQSAIVTVLVYLEDIRQENPIFPPPWSPSTPQIVFSIPEEPIIGSTLFTLTAKNPGRKGLVTFEILQDDEKYVSVDEATGVVTLKRRLDYEALPSAAKHISFLVKAVAQKGEGVESKTSSATVIIDVQDINDNSPIFTQESYHVSIAESALYPHTLLTVKASDKDQQSSFGDVRYSLSGDGEDIFTMDHITGIISLRKGTRLDRETKVSYNVKVTGIDNPEGNGNRRSTSALLFVQILDVNDNAPRFLEPLYQAIIPENVAPGFGIKQVKAKDQDLGESGLVTYAVEEASHLKEFLTVNETTGHVTVAKALSGKGRSDPYKVIIRASDHGLPQLSTDVHMLLFITDVSTNDGIPTFVRPEIGERIQVAENAPAGTMVTVVQAKDPDDPKSESGRLRYSFLGEGSSSDSDQEKFAIDPIRGTITTRHPLDRESQEMFSVVVMVRDFGYPPQHRARMLNIHVADEDDHLPLFPRPKNSMPLEMTVKEEVAMGTTIGFIEAQDLDDGENAAIDYVIIDGNTNRTFAINRTWDNRGEIYAINRIDCENQESYLITIQARKLEPNDKSKASFLGRGTTKSSKRQNQYDASDLSMAQVRIKVRDIDDNNPRFVQSNLTTGIRATSGPGLDVFTFKAIDEDTTSSSLEYMIKDVSYISVHSERQYPLQNGFALDSKSGILRTATPMDKYKKGYFAVGVQASSNNKSAFALLRVFVLEGREMLKFNFNKPLAEVRKSLTEFRKDLRSSLTPARPLDINLYDSQFSAQEGAVNASSLCFQFLVKDNILEPREAEALLDLPNRPKLGLLYHNYGVRSVEECEIEGKLYTLTWVEICVLVIAALIGIVALACGVIICSLHTRYKKKMNRTVYQVVVGAPADTNGNGYATINRQRIHEWQDRSPPPVIRDFTYGSSYA